MPDNYESIIDDDEQFQELMDKFREAASSIAQIIKSADYDKNGELTENELTNGILDLILQLVEGSSDTPTTDPSYETPSGYTFTGIQKGSKKLDLVRITNAIKYLQSAKSNIGHTHPASSIVSGQLDPNRLPGYSNGGLDVAIKTSDGISQYDEIADITADMITDSDSGSTSWNGITSDKQIDYKTLDKSGHDTGSFRNGIQASGTVYSGMYARNYWRGSYQENYIYAGVNKTASGMEDVYKVKDRDKFYKGIQPLPRHLGILAGEHTLTTAAAYYTDSSTITFDFGDNGPSFSNSPYIVVTIENGSAGNQANAQSFAGISYNLISVSKTSFKIRVFNSTQKSGLELKLNWIAIGPYTY